MPLVDTSTGEEYGTAPISNEYDIDNAYAAAAKAFADWAHHAVAPAGAAWLRRRCRESRRKAGGHQGQGAR